MIELTFDFDINDRAFVVSKNGIQEVVIIEARAEVSQRGTVQTYRVANVCTKITSIVDVSQVVASYDVASTMYEQLLQCTPITNPNP